MFSYEYTMVNNLIAQPSPQTRDRMQIAFRAASSGSIAMRQKSQASGTYGSCCSPNSRIVASTSVRVFAMIARSSSGVDDTGMEPARSVTAR